LAVPSGGVRLDIGRLVMVPTVALLVFAELHDLDLGGGSGATGVLRSAGVVLEVAFYALVIWCYLRRGPAVATSDSITAHAAAVTATWLLFALPLLQGPAAGQGRQALSDVLVVCGLAWAIWSLRFLGRSMSVLAQARAVIDQGPYRWVRHPLYTGEIVAGLGVALAADSYGAVALWVGLCGLQVYRALREEQVLMQALPAYRSYRERTAALLPGVF
jgi:protein-S-isoprenylcysteine O-methyltransferase Ste14